MSVLWVSVLLSLLSLSVAAPTPEDCSQLIKPITREERPKISGKWILIEAFTSDEFFGQYLKNHDSFWQLLTPYNDSQNIGVIMHGAIEEQCYSAAANTTFINDNTLKDELASFLQTVPDCLLINYKLNTFQALLVFGRSTSLSESDLESVRKQAECLQYPLPAVAHYNTDIELCPEGPGKIEFPLGDV